MHACMANVFSGFRSSHRDLLRLIDLGGFLMILFLIPSLPMGEARESY